MDELTRLAVAARHGDPQAMGAFIAAGQRQVRSLCAYLVDEVSADDLAQETYLRVFRALPAFRQESSARTWLLAIARRVCMDELRLRTRRRRQETLVAGPADAEPDRSRDTDQVEVREVLGHLPPARRDAFVLTQMLGLSYEDAARICECPVGTIRSRVARARVDLIEALGLVAGADGRHSARTASRIRPDGRQ
ncbi:sigma-70 family RNA polymerase sigma factor [Amycolatopsis sp. NBC_01480]|uniref:sigma-70 family RNA polymerase sigma factor n=1 Tax=Amycolatopsis sp. NBC_01480 TaxID=2903562 RepID=UPI002E2E7E7A|nr:sigma-70 family RNA polymerase sigma factor [Amycolatopsis sp. NBC_01480]